MANRPLGTGTDDDTGVRPTADRPPGTPRWVKVFGIIALILVLLIVAMMFIGGGGEHGPGRHASFGDTGGQTPPSGIVTEDHAPSTGAHTRA